MYEQLPLFMWERINQRVVYYLWDGEHYTRVWW